MMSGHWMDRLSEYIDGELSDADRAALEAHLDGCADCSRTLAELRDVVATAGALPDAAPTHDLWPGIEARLTSRRSAADGARAGAGTVAGGGAAGPGASGVLSLDAVRRRVVTVRVPRLIAAGIALVVLSWGGAWLALTLNQPAAEAPAVAAAPGEGAFQPVVLWEPYEAAVSELEAEFARRRGTLEPSTIVVVERNLAIIESALAESRQALEADPSSAFLNAYVADAMRRKVDLLRQVTRIERTEM